MWPRIALWVAGFVAIPAAKWIWDKILEPPSYYEDVDVARAAKEQADKEELGHQRKGLNKAGQNQHEILFRKFDA